MLELVMNHLGREPSRNDRECGVQVGPPMRMMVLSLDIGRLEMKQKLPVIVDTAASAPQAALYQ
jgi:hypothetical protein